MRNSLRQNSHFSYLKIEISALKSIRKLRATASLVQKNFLYKMKLFSKKKFLQNINLIFHFFVYFPRPISTPYVHRPGSSDSQFEREKFSLQTGYLTYKVILEEKNVEFFTFCPKGPS
jgi:hypothetical protein